MIDYVRTRRENLFWRKREEYRKVGFRLPFLAMAAFKQKVGIVYIYASKPVSKIVGTT